MREYVPQYLEKETYRRVLSVARSYYQDLNKIRQIENDIIMATSRPEAGGRSSYISDTTYNQAQQIEKYTSVLRARTDAVEWALSKFNEHEQDAIKQNLFKGIPMIYCDVKYSERGMQRLRHDFLMMLAIELGETI